MNALLRNTLAVGAVAFATQATAQITFYEQESFAGRSVTTEQSVDNLERIGFNDRASSVVVTRDRWEVCEHAQFGGRCAVLSPGWYPSLAPMGLNGLVSSVRGVGRDARIDDRRYAPGAGGGQITFYEHEGFAGRSFTTEQSVDNFERFSFNKLASSVVVTGNGWEVCEDAQFGGRCIALQPGRHASLAAMGLNDRVSSVRNVSRSARSDDHRYAPVAGAGQITFYEHEGFAGRSFTTEQSVDNFERFGFNDRASSVVVARDNWEVCEAAQFGGRCVVLRPGSYASLASLGLNDRVSSARDLGRNARTADNRYGPAPVAGQITFYEQEDYGGRSFATEQPIDNLSRVGFNDRAASVIVAGRWEVCEHAQFGGRCVVLRPGRYPSLAAIGLDARISSVRNVGRSARVDDRFPPSATGRRGDRRRRDDDDDDD